MASFPSYGVLLFSGFEERYERGPLRTEMESGPPKLQRRFDKELISRPVRYLFTQAEYDSFKTFVRTTLNGGTDFFDWTDPQTSTTKSVRLAAGKIEEARPYVPSLSHWIVGFTLELWE